MELTEKLCAFLNAGMWSALQQTIRWMDGGREGFECLNEFHCKIYLCQTNV